MRGVRMCLAMAAVYHFESVVRGYQVLTLHVFCGSSNLKNCDHQIWYATEVCYYYYGYDIVITIYMYVTNVIIQVLIKSSNYFWSCNSESYVL